MSVDADPVKVVRQFCSAWDRLDFDAIAAFLAEEIEYHNIPIEPLSGKAAVEGYLRGVGPFEQCEWEIVSIAAQGNRVLIERVDHFTIQGHRISLPVMGTFEIENGLIRRWRDYFDLASYRAQWPKADLDGAT